MKKSIKYLSLFLVVGLFFIKIQSINADVTCYYNNKKIEMGFKIDDDGKAGKVTINGEIDSTDETEIKDEREPIVNWNKSQFTKFVGKNYYNKNKACPPYLAFYDRKGAFRVYAGKTEKQMEKIADGLKDDTIALFWGGLDGWSGAVKLSKETDNLNENNNKGDSQFSATATSCTNFTTEEDCLSSINPKCVWNSEYEMCSVNGNAYLSCGDAKDIPPVVPELMSYAVNLLKILTPIILIIIGIIELVKAVASTNEDSMKKAQSKLIKKVVAAVMVFFVITIVQFITLKVADSSDAGSIKTCLKCFLNGTDDCDGIYVKDGYGMCYYKDGTSKSCDSIAESE